MTTELLFREGDHDFEELWLKYIHYRLAPFQFRNGVGQIIKMRYTLEYTSQGVVIIDRFLWCEYTEKL